MADRTPWTSVDKAKLAVDILGILASASVAIAIFSFQQHYTRTADESARAQQERFRAEEAAEQERGLSQERQAQVIRQRAALWEKMAGPLNDIYSYYLFVGQWKDLSERDIVGTKRLLDKLVYANRPFFSDEFVSSYQSHMDAVCPIPRHGC